MRSFFSFGRFWAIVVKEFIQMRRDRMTFGMMIGIPLIQLTLFGFAINSDPKHLPTAVRLADNGPQGRTLLQAIKNTGYFNFVKLVQSEDEGRELFALGKAQFVVNIPENFSRQLIRGERPAVLVEADGTDPVAISNAVRAMYLLVGSALREDLKGSLSYLDQSPAPAEPVELRLHALFNPEGISQYNIVPGLMGVVLTMTMVLITSLAITRERESGTMENLLTMPTRPFEVMIGKIIPYILVGYIQLTLILLASYFVFHVPIEGNLILLLLAALVFIAANLAVGITFSTIAQNQRQAMQMGMFFFLPSLLLSGFMFPFRGMPFWAQCLGEVFPLTHFVRIVRGVVLKGNGVPEVAYELWPIFLFATVMLTVGVKRYRKTLD